ncbi:MAG: hypothetical protein US83_C0004G0082 [Candidatus Falkowbacteria bacterium GW2011_GWC2_38_22]|uniref:Multidrug resistance protein MdtA-like beta-barrel domain-containing protein n=1 Tax=Candidatus Falkowbacteria bacterium GW2011_GWE1_38_31 TaxID=1618638 RepID=A0A0G0K513_9BACT|nr:MAG: hypothetical protein US73_C0002G0035 [Candidatus Falkowbacteria bacterium GW2011_GWF2_38_1205]KKQ61698.1 MAG: hypothetical protein US83_C0004G0082 [Candidatus Falkowbacteria bacterium GW2011_GWC2_38_22]KKQ63687.1 MAG: hypothetical protein US84_C0004G0035 [Candidatus Falkowbacteria bacterium GW2011_GWF1_38_22]KKQ65897.1 MAG: hypothetical protein US87_C0004G0082 [Candidatus Falkowbacteria bacterium GW2011_GWE2_38_254]KKQ70550.1 MAG: hypothetical protein US91_C0004G0035 [Candidatus Falkowb
MATKKKYLIIIIVGLFAILFFIITTKGRPNQYETVKPQKGEITATVLVSGETELASSIDLNFKNSGKLIALNTEVGQIVGTGEILAEQDDRQLKAEIDSMQADINLQVTRLNQALAGASKESIKVSEVNVSKTKTAYESAINKLENTKKISEENIAEAEKSYQDIISNTDADITTYEQSVITNETSLENTKKTVTQTISNKLSSSLILIKEKLDLAEAANDATQKILDDDVIKYSLSVKNLSYLNSTELNLRIAGEKLDDAMSKFTATSDSSQSVDNIISAYGVTIASLNASYVAASDCLHALIYSVTSSSFTQSDLDVYKASMNTQKANLTAGITALQNSQQTLQDAQLSQLTSISNAEKTLDQSRASLKNAKQTLLDAFNQSKLKAKQDIGNAQAEVDSNLSSHESALAQLEQAKAPSRKVDIDVYRSQIAQAEASKRQKETNLEDMLIRATATGTISQITGEVGEIISPETKIITLLPVSKMQVKVDISENNIADIKTGQTVRMWLDAFGEEKIFSGKITRTDPSDSVVSGAVYYKTVVVFEDNGDELIKPGMSVNVYIDTASKADVLTLPISAIKNKNGKNIIQTLENNQSVEKEVTTGLKDKNGRIEIVSGITESDDVIIGNKAK